MALQAAPTGTENEMTIAVRGELSLLRKWICPLHPVE